MIILFFVIIPIFLISTKLILYIIVRKYGRFSYDGFSAAGFLYNPEKDIFYSTKNAWQKNFGYAHIYDVLAPIFRMIIDTEPVRFYYNNKNWLLTFWKGQYGIVTGAEIGIYCTTEQKVNKRTLYYPVSNNELLNMDLILYKNGHVITKVSATHWWLAIFKLGMFSKPKELTMDINITFLDKEMLDAFLKSFKKLGYKSKDYTVIDNTFCFRYIKPKTRKVWTRTRITDGIRQFFNKKNVELYNLYLKEFVDNNKIDDSKDMDQEKLIRVNEMIPDVLKNESVEDDSIRFYGDDKSVVFLNSDVIRETSVKKNE